MKHSQKWLLALMLLFLATGGYFAVRELTATPPADVVIPSEPVPQPELPQPTPIPTPDPQPQPEIESDPSEDLPEDDGLPHDKLFITPERQRYADGDLVLIIPKLDKKLTVYAGTEPDTLNKGVGLYDYAQLPGEGNRNVSIAGHRNGRVNGVVTDQAPFYYIDTLADGDYLYLTDSSTIYRYVWDSSEIVADDDWGPIYSQGFSCLTLTSCHPIGISTERIIVRGRLDQTYPLTADFIYEEQQEVQP